MVQNWIWELQVWLAGEDHKVESLYRDEEEKFNLELQWVAQQPDDDSPDPSYLLRGVIGYGDSIEEAIEMALDKFNQTESKTVAIYDTDIK